MLRRNLSHSHMRIRKSSITGPSKIHPALDITPRLPSNFTPAHQSKASSHRCETPCQCISTPAFTLLPKACNDPKSRCSKRDRAVDTTRIHRNEVQVLRTQPQHARATLSSLLPIYTNSKSDFIFGAFSAGALHNIQDMPADLKAKAVFSRKLAKQETTQQQHLGVSATDPAVPILFGNLLFSNLCRTLHAFIPFPSNVYTGEAPMPMPVHANAQRFPNSSATSATPVVPHQESIPPLMKLVSKKNQQTS
jgi:hypothetical protein